MHARSTGRAHTESLCPGPALWDSAFKPRGGNAGRDTGLSLVQKDHVTWILASDWSGGGNAGQNFLSFMTWGSHDGHSHLRLQPTLALMIMIYWHVDTLLFYFANFIFATIIYILFSYKCVSNKYQRSFWVFIMTILTLFISFMVLGKFIWQCLIRAEV